MKSNWTKQAFAKIAADYKRSADTHLIPVQINAFPNIDFYFKDESTHPTGSLKHRLARSLFLYALSNGWINQQTTIIESSSGSTAISEAYFSKLLGLPFIAVMAKTTAKEKINQIEFYGGQCHLVDCTTQIYAESHRLAKELDGHYMDQFTYAERATDWRGNNNIAQSIYDQMMNERYPIPSWVVMSPGTGGTSATIGRYMRYKGVATNLLVVDPDNSVFYDYYQSGDASLTNQSGSRIEGIGRPRVEPSFMPGVIDDMLKVSDGKSIAAMHWLSDLLGRKVGPSSGTNLVGMLHVAEQMKKVNHSGSIVSLICDSGERYLNTYYNKDWQQQNIPIDEDYTSWLIQLNHLD
jgi:cysteine synthase A